MYDQSLKPFFCWTLFHQQLQNELYFLSFLKQCILKYLSRFLLKFVLNVLNPIISKYVEDNSITIVFPKKNIIIAKKNLDITTTIMNLLNNQLKKIDF